MDCQGAQEEPEGQEDQGDVQRARGTPLAVLGSPCPPGLPSASSPGSLAIHQAILILKPAVSHDWTLRAMSGPTRAYGPSCVRVSPSCPNLATHVLGMAASTIHPPPL